MVPRHYVGLFAALIMVAGCDEDALDPNVPSNFGEVGVSIATTGYEPDFTGYSVTLDGGGPVATDFNDDVVLYGAPSGSNTIVLAGVGDHCTVGNNPATVTVAVGQRSEVEFDVACEAITGSTTLTVTQTGEAADFDPSFSATADSGTSAEVTETFDSGAPHTIFHLAEGAHEVRLQGIAANCTATERILPVTVTLGADAPLAYAVDCVPNVGSVQVDVTTTGANLDTGYEVTVNDGAATAVVANGSVDITGVRVGDASVALSGVADNCDVTGGGANPAVKSAEIEFGEETVVAFTVSCE